MGLIQADVERLRAAIGALKQGHSEIESALRQVSQAMNALQNRSWAGRHRQQAEVIWNQLQGRFSPLLDALQQLSDRTVRFTDAFEAAGSRFDSGKGIVPTSPDVRAPERGIAGSINSGNSGTDSPTNSPSDSAPPSSPLPPVLNQRVRLRNGAEVLPTELDGRTPVAGWIAFTGSQDSYPCRLLLPAIPTIDIHNSTRQLSSSLG
ncbi:WXG100 family type VII secretion target [Chloroflexus sp. Y-396-1]|uniref:WXG100 family type VII secretion target n=1 Tax=Chloroflexus sp. Y-396-1 TaxID=867845 RepID=UPI0004BB4CFC|nr:WXG100 family type VII secretion target [Chloroflexus sp. Y-396-1]